MRREGRAAIAQVLHERVAPREALGRDHLFEAAHRLQPVLIGTDTQAMEANTKVFGHVLACPDVQELAHRLSAWLRAVVVS